MGKYFGKPPFGDIQTDNYASLGHESYTLPTAYIGWALVLIFVCMFLLCLLGFNHLAFFSKRTELAYRENAKCFNRFWWRLLHPRIASMENLWWYANHVFTLVRIWSYVGAGARGSSGTTGPDKVIFFIVLNFLKDIILSFNRFEQAKLISKGTVSPSKWNTDFKELRFVPFLDLKLTLLLLCFLFQLICLDNFLF